MSNSKSKKPDPMQPSEAILTSQENVDLSSLDQANIENTKPKYATPRIALFDLPHSVGILLSEAGLNVTEGSFGKPYRVEKDDGYTPVIPNGYLPAELREQDIVIIDLEDPEVATAPEREKVTADGKLDWWASKAYGVVDPRPRVMKYASRYLDQITKHGGVFVIFADSRSEDDQILGRLRPYHGLEVKTKLDYDNWSFLSKLAPDVLTVESAQGSEIFVSDEFKTTAIGLLLRQNLGSMSYSCTLDAPWLRHQDKWVSLATDKYGGDVAAVILPDPDENNIFIRSATSYIFIFPQLKDKALFLKQFLFEVLADITPQHFPFADNQQWIHHQAYELPKVIEMRNEIATVRALAEQHCLELEQRIQAERDSWGYLYDLVRESGNALKAAVIKALSALGFTNIIDVDAQGSRDEDLQIWDNSPILLVEVKGISGLPGDDDSLQVGKHIAPRMREWNRTDVQGLVVINHQKHLPPLERESQPYRPLIIENGKKQEIALMTTWDLYRLVRGCLAHDWKPDSVKPLFYAPGRVTVCPTHYQYCGKIEIYWSKPEVVGIRMEEGVLRQGDRIAFELANEFVEQVVDSLQVDHTRVDAAHPGDLAGVKTGFTKAQMQKRVSVYRISLTNE